MAARRYLLLFLVVLAACTPPAISEDTTTSTVPATVPPTTTTTIPPEPENDDLRLLRDGLITSERSVVDELFGTTPFYELEMSLSDDLTMIGGTERVTYTNHEEDDLEEIVFRLFPNIADGSSTVANVSVDGVPVEPVFDLEQSVMRVPLGQALSPGDGTVIEMTFEVMVPIEEGGNYGTFLFDREILAAAHFYPILAVYDDEGWNAEIPPPSGDVVYSDVAFYRVSITAPDTLPIVTSGRLVAKEAPGQDGLGVKTFLAGPVRDFYLAASNRFVMQQASVGETTINSYAPAEFGAENREVLDYAAQSMQLFNRLYGPYPYVEFDIVSTATAALGVEYPGVIAMSMYHYERPEGYVDANMISTVVHEVAHQWFYGTVGNDQLDEPWLDEALAQYATWDFWRYALGAGADQGFRDHLNARWDRVERADIPIGLPVASYEGSEYGAIVYGRGPLFLDDLAQSMGEEMFDEFLLDYSQSFKYGIATTTSFQDLAEETCGCDLTAEFEAAVYPRS